MIERHPLTLAFPLDIGLIVLMIVIAAVFMFGERMTKSQNTAEVTFYESESAGNFMNQIHAKNDERAGAAA